MSIQSINSATNFNKHVQTQKNLITFKNQTPINITNTKQNSPKGRWWHPFASFWVAGLGQFLQGRNEDGVKHLVTSAATTTFIGLTARAMLSLIKTGHNKTAMAISLLTTSATLAKLGINGYSAYDAYKGINK